jgi:enoyl-CoA hydratase
VTATEFVRCEIDGPVAIVTLNRPPVNAVTQAMYGELQALFDTLGRDDAVHVALLAADGPHFCAGNDLNEFVSMDSRNWVPRMRTVRNAFFSISDCAIPVVAAVGGAVLGSGVALAASCDVVVAADDARFGLPEIGVGVMGGARHLARLAPQGVVRWMMLSAEPVPVEELAAYGGIHRVVPRESLLDAARETADAIARHGPLAIRAAKRSLNRIEWMDLKAGYEYEQTLTGELASTADAKEAVHAFVERRAPRYSGH